jgi:hypothetical protein
LILIYFLPSEIEEKSTPLTPTSSNEETSPFKDTVVGKRGRGGGGRGRSPAKQRPTPTPGTRRSTRLHVVTPDFKDEAGSDDDKQLVTSFTCNLSSFLILPCLTLINSLFKGDLGCNTALWAFYDLRLSFFLILLKMITIVRKMSFFAYEFLLKPKNKMLMRQNINCRLLMRATTLQSPRMRPT